MGIILVKFSIVSMLASHAYKFLPSYVNNFTGLLGCLGFFVFLILFLRLPLSGISKGILTLWAIIPIFICNLSAQRYLVSLLPAWAIIIVLGINSLKGIRRYVFLGLFLFNDLF